MDLTVTHAQGNIVFFETILIIANISILALVSYWPKMEYFLPPRRREQGSPASKYFLYSMLILRLAAYVGLLVFYSYTIYLFALGGTTVNYNGIDYTPLPLTSQNIGALHTIRIASFFIVGFALVTILVIEVYYTFGLFSFIFKAFTALRAKQASREETWDTVKHSFYPILYAIADVGGLAIISAVAFVLFASTAYQAKPVIVGRLLAVPAIRLHLATTTNTIFTVITNIDLWLFAILLLGLVFLIIIDFTGKFGKNSNTLTRGI